MLKNLMITDSARESFFPTPLDLTVKLLADLDWNSIENVLEPSAGKGDLVRGIAERILLDNQCGHKVNVDCIEFDPYLRSVLQYEFMGQKQTEIEQQLAEFGARGELSSAEASEWKALQAEAKRREQTICHIVHDDFLTFNSRKPYQLIVMNPPFERGADHLLKAIELQSRYGGQIRCLLNAETIRNPYTIRRQVLKNKLDELGASVVFEKKAFAAAERQTDVEVAIIKVDIPVPKRESRIFESLRKAAKLEDKPVDDVTDLTVQDFFERIVSLFEVEIDAGIELILEYKAMLPYIMSDFSDKTNCYRVPNLILKVGRKEINSNTNINEYLTLTRGKYWRALFSNKDFLSRLTSNLRDEYMGSLDRMGDYDFTLYNIQQLNAEMNAKMRQGIEATIVALFDKMTQQHAWYPECAKNIHYYNGWQTNKVHKINNKVILPIYGIFSDYTWSKDTFNVREAEETISDIEKVFDYLDGNMTAPVSLHGALQRACEEGRTKNIQCKYFAVTMYKKGTMHIKFHSQELVDRFNIYCCQHKNWLPPSYGKVKYRDMNRDERAVVDSFHADGSEGAGETAYNHVMAKKAYYLDELLTNITLLPSGE